MAAPEAASAVGFATACRTVGVMNPPAPSVPLTFPEPSPLAPGTTPRSAGQSRPVDVGGLPPGPLTTEELDARVPARLVREHYHRLWRGMYRREDQADDLLFRSRALARSRPDGILRGRSAAAVWGDDSAPEGTLPEIWVPIPSRALHGRIYRHGTLPRHAVTEVAGLPVTTPLRTCRDLVGDLEFEDAVVSIERLCAKVAELPAQLRAAAEHPAGRAGRRFTRVVEAVDLLSASAMSSRARLLLAGAGCGSFRHGHRVVLGAGPVELPLADPVARCVVFTSPITEGRAKTAARHQSLLQAAGWTVIIVRGRDRGRDRGREHERGIVTPAGDPLTGSGVVPATATAAAQATAAAAGRVAVPRRASGLLAVRWPDTELRLPADPGPADDPHGLWGEAW